MLTQPDNHAGHRTVVHEVDRAICELRRGGDVVLEHGTERWRVVAAESMDENIVHDLYNDTGTRPILFVSRLRATALGLPAQDTVCVALRPAAAAASEAYQVPAVQAAPPPLTGWEVLPAVDPALGRALMGLAKCAQLMPALIGVPVVGAAASRPAPMRVRSSAIAHYWSSLAATLVPVADAPVPLSATETSRFVLFRAADGRTEHVAVVVGVPDMDGPVLVRMHSACFTGDLFASLKCDCGEQLRTAVGRMARAGGGVLVYLNQEGRGIGLANKLRAYGLQGQGYDTLDADASLGFDADERQFEVAASMLKALNVRQVRLLTNNPAKVRALEQAGIHVHARLAVIATANPHNERYLRTKAARAGHLFDPCALSVGWHLAAVAVPPLDPTGSA